MTLVNAETGEVVAPLDRDEAERLTERIREAAGSLWRLLCEAHDRQAWAALGYSSFSEYATTEFSMSEVHAYRLVSQGAVIREIEQAAGLTRGLVDLTEREARDLKPHLNLVTERVRTGTAGAAPEEVKARVSEIVSKVRREVERERQERNEQREWVKENTPDGFDAKENAELVRQRGLLLRLPREVQSLGDPAEAVHRHGDDLREAHIAAIEETYCWLDAFLNEWRNR